MSSLVACAFAVLLAPVIGAEDLTRKGDRVVFLGGTFVERMQTSGFIETEWASISHSKAITFRNLGWSGDNVVGEARAVFGDVQAGYERLLRDLKLASPTLTVIHYGNAEPGHAESVAEFAEGLRRLIVDVRATGSRVLLLGLPSRFPVRDSVALNSNRAHNRAELDRRIKQIADTMDCTYLEMPELPTNAVGLSDRRSRSPFSGALSVDGEQLTSLGYWSIAPSLCSLIESTTNGPRITAQLGTSNVATEGVSASIETANPREFELRFSLERLPRASPGIGTTRQGIPGGELVLRVRGLARGQYSLVLDEQPLTTASHARLASGIRIPLKEDRVQSDQLRQAIQKKNQLFFHRYRPQNETYLFLFRKHEQGNNAVEVPMFDPLVEDQDRLIHRLSVPPRHQLTIGLKK